jgi:hypothetical protein
LLALLGLAPFGAQGAVFVVEWERASTLRKTTRSGEVIATFERESGKQVELGFYPQESARSSSKRLDRLRLESRQPTPVPGQGRSSC